MARHAIVLLYEPGIFWLLRSSRDGSYHCFITRDTLLDNRSLSKRFALHNKLKLAPGDRFHEVARLHTNGGKRSDSVRVFMFSTSTTWRGRISGQLDPIDTWALKLIPIAPRFTKIFEVLEQ